MNKQNRFICALISIILIFTINLIQDNFFIQKNVNIPLSEIETTCNQLNTHCQSSINLNISNSINTSDKFVTVNLYNHVIAFKIIQILLLCVLMGIFILTIYLNRKNKKEDANFSFGDTILFGFLAVYQIFYLYTNNITSILIGGGIILLISLLCYLILFYLLKLITKHNIDSTLITIILMIILYNIKLFLGTFPYYNYFEIIGLILILIIAITLTNTKKIIVFLKPFTITLIVLCLFNSIYKEFKTPNIAHAKEKQLQNFNVSQKTNRDIYIILLDMYAGKDTLKHLGYDNSKFLNTLRNKGFLVFDNINSNYNKTLASVPSVLNFDYLTSLPYETSSDAISESAMFRIAKYLNYNIFYLNSWPLELSINDIYINHIYNSDFYLGQASLDLFFNNTIFESITNALNKTNPIENTLKFMQEVIKYNKSKKIVFAHFLMPHPPYLYDENGNILKMQRDIPIQKSKYKQNNESYLSFLKYTNNKTLEIVNKLLSTDDNKPIIIIFGDHGIRETYYTSNEQEHFTELTQDEFFLKAHFNTFLAYYNPDIDKQNYKNTNSLVNFFRKFANDTFGTNFNQLPDKKFYIYYDQSPTHIHNIKGQFVK